jgi:hypothetical protein
MRKGGMQWGVSFSPSWAPCCPVLGRRAAQGWPIVLRG